jgi:hypothetical protein
MASAENVVIPRQVELAGAFPGVADPTISGLLNDEHEAHEFVGA